MTKKLLLTGLWIAVISVVASSGVADARGRYGNCGGRGWRNANYGYTSNGGYRSYYSTNYGTVSNQGMNQTYVNGTALQTNANYSVNRPTYQNPAPINGVNSSPDSYNDGRNASTIQGTTPTTAPAPLADPGLRN